MKPSFHCALAQRAFTMLATAIALTACGGSGGGNPPPTTPQSGLLVAGIGRSNGSAADYTLLIVDADKPAIPRLATPVDKHLATSGVTLNPTTGGYTLLGDSMVYFVKSGQLFQVSLHKADSTVAQRISSLTTACGVNDWHPLKLDGSDDAWVEVSEAGPDASCTQEGDNTTVFVRMGTPATTAATALPAGVTLLESLPDTSRSALGVFLASDQRGATPKLTIYSAAWAPLGDVEGSQGVAEFDMMGFVPGLSQGSSAYGRNGMSLQRLTWSSSSASLSAPIHTFANAANPGNDISLVDDAAMYFVDGLSVMRANAAGTVNVLGSLNPVNGDEASLAYAMTPTHLVLQQQASNGNSTSLYTLLKGGGTPVPLAAGASAPVLYGVHGSDVVYIAATSVGNGYAIRRVNADGSNDRLITDLSSGFPMRVFSPMTRFSGLTLDAVVWCEAAGADADCRNGSLKSQNLSTGVSTTLGSFSHASNSSSWQAGGFGYTGKPMIIQAYSFDSTSFAALMDMYIAQPLGSGSLVRVSSNVP